MSLPQRKPSSVQTTGKNWANPEDKLLIQAHSAPYRRKKGELHRTFRRSMSIKMGYTINMGHGYVCGDPQLQLMCIVLVLFSNVPRKTCVDMEVFAPLSVF